MAFGHQFQRRSGLPDFARELGKKGTFAHDQFSPVFIQFLECVHHLATQYPRAMEFNEVRRCEGGAVLDYAPCHLRRNVQFSRRRCCYT